MSHGKGQMPHGKEQIPHGNGRMPRRSLSTARLAVSRAVAGATGKEQQGDGGDSDGAVKNRRPPRNMKHADRKGRGGHESLPFKTPCFSPRSRCAAAAGGARAVRARAATRAQRHGRHVPAFQPGAPPLPHEQRSAPAGTSRPSRIVPSCAEASAPAVRTAASESPGAWRPEGQWRQGSVHLGARRRPAAACGAVVLESCALSGSQLSAADGDCGAAGQVGHRPRWRL